MDRIPDLDLPIPGPAQRSDVDKILAALKSLDAALARVESRLDDLDRKITALAAKVDRL